MVDYSPALQLALNQVPMQYQSGQYTGAQLAGQQAPINFAGQPQFASQQYYAPEKKEGSIFSFRNLLIAGALTVGAVAAHKTSGLGKEFKALEKVGAVKGEYKFGQNFLHNANPLNWFGNAETAKAAETAGLNKIGKSERFFQHEGDTVQISGNKIRNLDGKVNDDATKLLTPAKAVKADADLAADATTDVSKVSKRTPETLEDNITMAQTKVGRLDNSIKKIETDIADTKALKGSTAELESKLQLAKQAKCVQEIEVLEAQKLKLQTTGGDTNSIEAQIEAKKSYAINVLKLKEFPLSQRLDANKAYRENKILMNKENGLAPTEYEQAYVKYDGKGLFKGADSINGGKFVDGNSADVTIAPIQDGADKGLYKGVYQDALNEKRTHNISTASDRATQAATAEQLKNKMELNTLLSQKKYNNKELKRIQELAATILPGVKISRANGTVQVSKTIFGKEESATGQTAINFLKQKLAAA